MLDLKCSRWSLKTGSLVEAEIAWRKHAAEMDDTIKEVSNGTFQRFSGIEIGSLAARWSIQFQLINSENIAATMFTDVLPRLDAICPT